MNITAPKSGYISRVDTEGYGTASLLLGAGRNTKEDSIDYAAGIILHAKTGDYVNEGDVIATLYTERKDAFSSAGKKLLESTHIADEKPQLRPLILAKVQ